MENKRLRFVFYLLWTAFNVLQAWCIDLQGDEAYYWMYSKELAWGYFDHPPATAVLIKAGYLLFQNEVGVRLFFVLLGVATIWIIEKMIQPANGILFYAIVLSVAFLQIGMVFGGGMYAIPDFPLLFFESLFFYFYKKYLRDFSWKYTVLLSVTTGLLLLSKYHGILIIGFTLLSNLALLKQKSFWVIVGLSVVLLLPHLNWQFQNDFPSIYYHLSERSSKGYSISYTTEYIFTQPFILGPFISVLLIYLSIAYKPQDLFDRSLKYVFAGTYIFFFIMTFKGRVEGNWTVIALVPLLYIGYRQILQDTRLIKFTYYVCAISILVIVTVRVLLIGDWLPSSLSATKSLHSKRWSLELKEKTLNRPVAFMNSYQRASLYEFYAGSPAFSINNVWGRKNQYNIWDTESMVQGKSVALVFVADITSNQYDSVLINSEYLRYDLIENFRSSSNVMIKSEGANTIHATPRDTITISMKFNYMNNNYRDLEGNPELPSFINYSFFQHALSVEMRNTEMVLKNEMIGNGQSYSISVITPAQPGEYDLYLSVQTGSLPAGINGRKLRIIVE